jgi:hypothetical protein
VAAAVLVHDALVDVVVLGKLAYRRATEVGRVGPAREADDPPVVGAKVVISILKGVEIGLANEIGELFCLRGRLHVYESVYDYAYDLMHDFHARQIGIQFFN